MGRKRKVGEREGQALYGKEGKGKVLDRRHLKVLHRREGNEF